MKQNRNMTKHLLIILLAVLVIVGSFYMPKAVYAYENYKLNNYDIRYDMKPLMVETEQIALTEKLLASKEAVSANSYLEVDIDSYQNTKGKVNLDEEKAVQIAKDVLVSLFAGQSVYSIGEISRYKKELENIDGVSAMPYLIVETEYMSTFLVWNVNLYNFEEDDYMELYIDDETGLLLSMSGTKTFCGINHTECARNGNMEKLIGSYYGLHFIARSITESMETSRITGQYAFNTMDYRYILSNENETERVSVDMIIPSDDASYFYFNYYDLDSYNELNSHEDTYTQNISDMYNDTELEDYLYNGGGESIDDENDISDDDLDLSSETDADMPE